MKGVRNWNRKMMWKTASVLLSAAMLFSSVAVYAAEEDEAENLTVVTTALEEVPSGIEMNTDYPGMAATAGDTISFSLDFISAEVRGESSFSSEYPEQEGATGTFFSFDATLINNRSSAAQQTLSDYAAPDWRNEFRESVRCDQRAVGVDE